MFTRRAIFIFVLLLMMNIALVSCKKQEPKKTSMEKIQQQLTTMENYQCTASVTYISNKGENRYGINQYYKLTGEYRIEMTEPEEMKGIVTVFDGTKVVQYNPGVVGKIVSQVQPSQARNEIFLGAFLKNYLQSEEVTMEVLNMEQNEHTVLEAVIPGENPYLSSEKLWMDNETLKPIRLVIYSKQGKETVIVEYYDFQYNTTLEDALFHIE